MWYLADLLQLGLENKNNSWLNNPILYKKHLLVSKGCFFIGNTSTGIAMIYPYSLINFAIAKINLQ